MRRENAMKKIINFNKKFISFFLVVMMINTLVFTGHKVLAATAELSISVNDSSNQSIPQYENSGGQKSNNILNPPVRLAANATAKISYRDFNNVNIAKYQFVQASDLTTIPQFPQDSTMTDINLTPPNSQPAYGNDIGDQGTISTMQYVYAGNPGSASSSAQLTRDVSFGTPLSSTMLVQNATVSNDIPNYNVSKSNAFFAGTTKSWSGTVSLSDPTIYSDSNPKKNSTDYVYNPFNKTYCKPNANAAWKAMKFWGYFSPPQSGYYNLGAYSDDGAYGYIVVNGQNKEFVNDWSIASAFPRTNNTPILLSAGSYYPIYMEYYEGCPTQGAFTPVFKYDKSNSANASISKNDTVAYYSDNTIRPDKLMNMQQNWFYSSNTTTPGTIPGAYFGDVSGIQFPNRDGIYYIATRFVSDEGITSGLYGPFIIDKTPPTISNLSVVSNNSSSDKKAVAGNTLTIRFTASEDLQGNPQILINGYAANVTSYMKTSDNNYTATVNIGNDNSINSSGDKITNGPITVQINNYSDLSGNVGSPVQDNSVTFISNSLGITLELNQNPPDANGNVLVTANATAYGNGNSIKTMKYASGSQSVNYFTAGGTNLTTNPLTSSYNSNGILQSPVQSTFNVNTNGVYTVYATDSSGNVAVQTIEVSAIDDIPPVITIAPYNTNPTNQDITVTATTNKGTLNQSSYTFTQNGSFTFTATDSLGNSSSKTVTITNIDKVVPTLNLTQDPTNTTDGTVTITAKASDDVAVASITTPDGKTVQFNPSAQSNSTTYTVNANDTYIFKATDTAGNVTTQSIKVSNIIEMPSSIENHGVYSENGDSIVSGNNVTNGMPVTMAMIVDAESASPKIKLTEDDNSKIRIDNNSFKEYVISSDNTIGGATELSIDDSGNISGLLMQKGGRYLIVYTITPAGSGQVTLNATADEKNSKEVTLNIGTQPDLF
jgi:hypothetical protein